MRFAAAVLLALASSAAAYVTPKKATTSLHFSASFADLFDAGVEKAFCTGTDPRNQLLEVDLENDVIVSPDPPTRGADVNIIARGNLKAPVGAGTTIQLKVKLGVLTVINREEDFCKFIEEEETGYSCPLPAGPLDLSVKLDVPGTIPKGKYKANVNIFNADGSITCLDLVIPFN